MASFAYEHEQALCVKAKSRVRGWSLFFLIAQIPIERDDEIEIRVKLLYIVADVFVEIDAIGRLEIDYQVERNTFLLEIGIEPVHLQDAFVPHCNARDRRAHLGYFVVACVA